MKIFKNFIIIFLLLTFNNLHAIENSERIEISKDIGYFVPNIQPTEEKVGHLGGIFAMLAL